MPDQNSNDAVRSQIALPSVCPDSRCTTILATLTLPVVQFSHAILHDTQLSALSALVALMQLSAIKVQPGDEQPYLAAAHELTVLINQLADQFNLAFDTAYAAHVK
jgi:hypothetical protein